MPGAGEHSQGRRRKGWHQADSHGVWRVDVELPRGTGEPRRRVSRTVEAPPPTPKQRSTNCSARSNRWPTYSPSQARRWPEWPTPQARSGGVTKLGHDRWLVGLEGEADPVSGDRRRHTKVVWGSREEAEAELALLRVRLAAGKLVSGTRDRNVSAACELYLDQAGQSGRTLSESTDRHVTASATRSWPAAARRDGYSFGTSTGSWRSRCSRCGPGR